MASYLNDPFAVTASKQPTYNMGPMTTGQQGPDALYGDFVSGSGMPLAKPNVRPGNPAAAFQPPAVNPFPSSSGPLQDPGNNMVNQGYGEQGLNYTQNRLLEDPYADQLQRQYQQTQTASPGERKMNSSLGALDGPGAGQQYWNQVSGQYQDPFAGEQFARQATQNFNANGPASAFYNQAMDQFGQSTGYNTQNAQNQYGQTSASLAGGTQGEQGLAGIAGQAGSKSTYSGPNNAAGQYGQNAASGPLAGQSYYDSVSGQQATKGTYSDPNLAAGQYGKTEQSFGALPVADSADPFYDRAIQIGTQDYNRQSAGRGVYGSSEALSGVGNIITDLNAKRAQNQFGNEMSIAQENRARQQLLGEQARQGDLSSLSAFGANLAGVETFGNLAKTAGEQTLGQQTMLGQQARNADLSATDAFNQNLQGATTFANINNQLANTELDRNRLLGDQANAADTQATSAQNARTDALSAFGNIAQSADAAETNRYNATTSAMNNADKTQLDRQNSGVENAFKVDDANRADFTATSNAAQAAATAQRDRTKLGADIASTGSQNDLARLNAFNETARGAETQRQARVQSKINEVASMSKDLANLMGGGLKDAMAGSQEDFENWIQSNMMPALTEAGLDQKQIDQLHADLAALYKSKQGPKDKG
jgi:hypothetical protein